MTTRYIGIIKSKERAKSTRFNVIIFYISFCYYRRLSTERFLKNANRCRWLRRRRQWRTMVRGYFYFYFFNLERWPSQHLFFVRYSPTVFVHINDLLNDCAGRQRKVVRKTHKKRPRTVGCRRTKGFASNRRG